jgi:hypothetical protein
MKNWELQKSVCTHVHVHFNMRDLPIGIFSGIGHAEKALASVLEFEVLIRELLSIDGLAAGAVAFGEVTLKD